MLCITEVFSANTFHPFCTWQPEWNNRVFTKWNGNLLNSGNLINHHSINWAQFKDPVSHMCLAGDVVAALSLTQEMAGW